MSDPERPDDETRPLGQTGWQQPDPQRGWDSPGSRPQSWDAPRPDQAGPQPTQQWGPPSGPPPPQGSYPPGTVPYGVAVADHPSANLALVLGIVGLVACGLVSPFAWVIGRNALRDIRASGGHYGGESSARAGQVLGIIGTVLMVLVVLAIVAIIVFAVVLAGTSTSSYSNV